MRWLPTLAAVAVSAACCPTALAAPTQASPRSCAQVWSHAPFDIRVRVASEHPLYAHLFVAFQSRGIPLVRPRCVFQFVLTRGRTLSVEGPYGLGAWTRPLPGTLTLPMRNNAAVRADGTLAFHT